MYRHEQPLATFGLGSSSRRAASSRELDDTISNASTGIVGSVVAKKAKERAKQEAPKAMARMAAARGRMEGARTGSLMSQAPDYGFLSSNPYRDALAKQQIDKAASDTAVGGIYTPMGLQKADKDATLNAHDRLLMRSLIPAPQLGLGGSIPGR